MLNMLDNVRRIPACAVYRIGKFSFPVALNLSSGLVRCDAENPAKRLAFLPGVASKYIIPAPISSAVAEVRFNDSEEGTPGLNPKIGFHWSPNVIFERS